MKKLIFIRLGNETGWQNIAWRGVLTFVTTNLRPAVKEQIMALPHIKENGYRKK